MFAGIILTLFPKFIVARLTHPEKEPFKQLSALKLTVVNPLQPENALFPMVLTELPIVIELRLVSP